MGFYKDPLDPSMQGAVLPCLSCEEILPGSTTAHVNSRSSDEYLGTKFWSEEFLDDCFESRIPPKKIRAVYGCMMSIQFIHVRIEVIRCTLGAIQ